MSPARLLSRVIGSSCPVSVRGRIVILSMGNAHALSPHAELLHSTPDLSTLHHVKHFCRRLEGMINISKKKVHSTRTSKSGANCLLVSGTAAVSLNNLKKDPCAPISGMTDAFPFRHACVFVAFPWRTIEPSTFRNTFAEAKPSSAFSPRLTCGMRWVVALRVAANPGLALNATSVIEEFKLVG